MLIDELSEKVAKKLGKSPVLVTQINRVQWKFLLDIMQNGEMKGVSFMYLGKFVKNAKYDENRKRIKYADRIKNFVRPIFGAE